MNERKSMYMWTYLCFFVALVLGFFCWRFYSLYKEYESEYLRTLRQYNELEAKNTQYLIKAKKDIANAKFQLIQRFITALCHPHPETVEIISCGCGSEIYREWVNGPPPNYRPYSMYFMYGDGRIIDRPEGVEPEKVIWPKSREHLRQFFADDADILWLYVEIYRKFVKNNNIKPNISNFVKDNGESHDSDGGLSQYRLTGDFSPITWLNSKDKPIRTHEGYLFTENIYKDWTRKAEAGELSSKGIHSQADLDKWLKRIGLHPVEYIS